MVTTSRIGRVGVAVVAVACLMLAIGSCGRDAVPADDIEQKISELVMRTEGRPAEAVHCPEPLPTKTGSSIRCSVTIDGGQTYGVTVKLNSVNGEQKADYEIEVDPTPTT